MKTHTYIHMYIRTYTFFKCVRLYIHTTPNRYTYAHTDINIRNYTHIHSCMHHSIHTYVHTYPVMY